MESGFQRKTFEEFYLCTKIGRRECSGEQVTFYSYGLRFQSACIRQYCKQSRYYDIVYLFLTELLGIEKKEANLEAEKMKQSMEDATLNKLAKYVQNQLGIQTLECNYDINNEKCIECSRRIKANQN